MYTELYEKYKLKSAVLDHPTLDCMGCAREMFCSYSFPIC